jgi:hypothetical protein
MATAIMAAAIEISALNCWLFNLSQEVRTGKCYRSAELCGTIPS